MGKTRIVVTIDEQTVKAIDRLVKKQIYPNRSQVVQDALSEKLERIERRRLIEECTKLDSAYEQAMAEEGMTKDKNDWPEY